jgi:hypothetical protein
MVVSQNALIRFAHGDITICIAIHIGLWPMNRIHERLIGLNQNGAMHRFDAFSGTSIVKTTGKKYNMQFANASSMSNQTLQFFRPNGFG